MPRTTGGLVLAEQPPASPRRRWVARLLVAALLLTLGYAAVRGVRGVLADLTPPTCTAVAAGARAEVTPEQAGNAAIVAGVATARQLPTRAAVIAIATAMQESKLRNLAFGDRDSLGLFQQRPSQGWGTREQILDPVFAAGAFYDRLSRVRDWQVRPLTEVAQQVQRSGFPGAYAQHEDEARALGAALTGSAEAALTCSLRAPTAAADPAGLVRAARSELGASSSVTGTTVVIGEEVPGWASAHWAMARAEALGVTEIRVGDRVWRRDGDASWSSGKRVGATTIVVGPAEGQRAGIGT